MRYVRPISISIQERQRTTIAPHERNKAEKMTPNTERPEMASAVASLELDVEVLALPVADALPVGLLAAAEPEPVALAPDDEAPEAEGRPVYRAPEVKGLQLLLDGTLAVYGIELMAPRDSGGWV